MKREPTGVIEGRVSHISVATLAMFAQQNGLVVTSKSQLVRLAFDLAADILTEQKAVPEIATTEQALEILQSLGLSALTRSDKGRGLLRQALEKDERRLEDFNPMQWAADLAAEQRGKCETVLTAQPDDAPSSIASIRGTGANVPTTNAEICSMIFSKLSHDFPQLAEQVTTGIEQFKLSAIENELQEDSTSYLKFLRAWEVKFRIYLEKEAFKLQCDSMMPLSE